MGCPSQVDLGQTLVFSICTHDPDTAILTDADAPPTYRLYSGEDGTALLTGALAKLDDGNTTGFYVESIACTAGNGFEAGKSYTIYVEATVDGNTGGMAYGFVVGDPLIVADAVLQRDIAEVEDDAAKRSLATAVLKSVSRTKDDHLGHILTYKTDGVTVKLTQDVSTSTDDEPIDELGVGA